EQILLDLLGRRQRRRRRSRGPHRLALLLTAEGLREVVGRGLHLLERRRLRLRLPRRRGSGRGLFGGLGLGAVPVEWPGQLRVLGGRRLQVLQGELALLLGLGVRGAGSAGAGTSSGRPRVVLVP